MLAVAVEQAAHAAEHLLEVGLRLRRRVDEFFDGVVVLLIEQPENPER